MVDVWGGKYSFRRKEVRDVQDSDLEKELLSRNYEFLTNKQFLELKVKVELNKLGKVSDQELAMFVYDTVGLIYLK